MCIAYSPVIHPASHQQLIVYLGTNISHCNLLLAEVFHSEVIGEVVIVKELALFSVKKVF